VRHKAGMAALSIGALGVVFGDIGTSPLYALQAVFAARGHAIAPDRAGVYGVISLIFWTITLVVSVKYVTFIMRADNRGEGGIMALLALIRGTRGRAVATLVGLGVLGASLFAGDGIITPAISVLSAVEGLRLVEPGLGSLVVPIALVILVALFAIQRYGSGAVGQLFGPIMLVWFAAIALCGLNQVARHPDVLRALSPSYGAEFLAGHADVALVALAAVALTITGAEALYADLGHFGRAPIRRAWFLVVFPALTLNYMGQGALILDSPATMRSPFFLLVPHWGLVPMVVLATVATVIASQAVISGVFSLTHQAAQLGFLPRLTIHHTSARWAGRIYVPAVNWLLCVGVAGLVVGFGSSQRLAGAYGIAVTGTMAITTVLFFDVVRTRRRAPLWAMLIGATAFLTVDLALFASTLTKLTHGGWVPVTVAALVFTILMTWHRGAEIVTRARIAEEGPLRRFVEEVRRMDPPVHRPPGTAVFLNAEHDTTPLALRANVEHNHVLHESVVIVFMRTLGVPHIDPARRVVVDDLGYRDDGITHLTVRFGYLDAHEVPGALRLAAARGLEQTIDVERASYFLSRITLVRTDVPSMRRWQKDLFIAMARNEAAAEYLRLPEDRTVTMGYVIEL
jgi:KUP system potassium uptake protein